jgi:RNA polymerase sigma factor (sigma-70 family)
MVNLIPNHQQSKLEEILQSKSLRIFLRYRLYIMKMNHLLTEDDVISHVCVELIKAYNSGKVINSPLAWSKVVGERYIICQRKKASKSEPTEREIIELNANNQQHHTSYEEREELKNKMKQLKLTTQNILEWRFFQNLSWEQIADLLSQQENKPVNVATARKRGERALKELRNLYIDNKP